ncbi:MAG TPA: YidC/Oxa1 family membrane protein insertase, partial [Candidatus Dormibacteraeota bacterium]|nr:YidC/Oxa1 family membrane protein insertase [Candidatus Dormibacteraeota bacterium]
ELVIAASFFDFLKPIGDFFSVLKIPFEFILGNVYKVLNTLGPLQTIGAYGLAIIVLTVVIKSALFPLYQKQLTMSRKTQEEQRRVAPELAALRKKHKGNPQLLNTEMMALYKEHGINPLGGLAGCLPTLAQLPILIGLYSAIRDPNFFSSLHASPHFLWIANLSHSATIHDPITWVLPALAGATTFIQSKMMAPPPAPGGDGNDQAAQMAQMTQTMSLIMPLVIIYFAFNPQIGQALVLYWIVSNIFSIGQQYFVNGWGQLPILGRKPAPALATAGGNGSGSGSSSGSGSGKALGTGRSRGSGVAASNGNGSGTGNAKVTPAKTTAGGKRKRR